MWTVTVPFMIMLQFQTAIVKLSFLEVPIFNGSRRDRQLGESVVTCQTGIFAGKLTDTQRSNVPRWWATVMERPKDLSIRQDCKIL